MTEPVCEHCEAELYPEDENLCYDCRYELEFERQCELRELRNDPDSAYFMAERFSDPGGDSALYPETEDNPRNLPCRSCGTENVLTPADRAAGYQCDACARQCEMGY